MENILFVQIVEPDNIKYSEFEGFGKDNKVINFRESHR